MSSFEIPRIESTSLNKYLKILVVGLALVAAPLLSAPGAHGPNGEHLDTNPQRKTTSNPKFEAFTETFELVGELFDSYIQINLHDYVTNKPISGASIELETNGALLINFQRR